MSKNKAKMLTTVARPVTVLEMKRGPVLVAPERMKGIYVGRFVKAKNADDTAQEIIEIAEAGQLQFMAWFAYPKEPGWLVVELTEEEKRTRPSGRVMYA